MSTQDFALFLMQMATAEAEVKHGIKFAPLFALCSSCPEEAIYQVDSDGETLCLCSLHYHCWLHRND